LKLALYAGRTAKKERKPIYRHQVVCSRYYPRRNGGATVTREKTKYLLVDTEKGGGITEKRLGNHSKKRDNKSAL
jgi:hypothetical protein